MGQQNLNNKIETTGGLLLEVHPTKCFVTDSNGEYPIPEEIALLVHGYSNTANCIIADTVTITKEKARNLAAILIELSNQTD